jgi:hypothetical protein
LAAATVTPLTGAVRSETIAYAALARSEIARTAAISSYRVRRVAGAGGVGASSIVPSVVAISYGFARTPDRVRSGRWHANTRTS